MEENKKSDYFSDEIEKSKQRETFYNQIVHELETGERYQEYFKQFSPESVKQFIAYYASQKVHWYEYGDILGRHTNQQSVYYHDEAVNLLRSIQKKKAFNAIIKWGSYNLDIPGAKTYYDFQHWLALPFTCPYITDIQPHEIDILISFINSLPETEKLKHNSNLHIHVFYLAHVGTPDIGEDDYPLFCRHYDDCSGLSGIMNSLPLRIVKECSYVEAWRVYKQQQEATENDNDNINRKPYLSPYNNELTDALIKKHESPQFQSMYQAQKREYAKNDFPWLPEEELDFLLDADEEVPVQAHDDWREGLGDAAERYKREQVIQQLPIVYKEYLRKRKEGSDFAGWQTDDGFMEKEWYDKHLAEILEGRKLLGEPADFNF